MESLPPTSSLGQRSLTSEPTPQTTQPAATFENATRCNRFLCLVRIKDLFDHFCNLDIYIICAGLVAGVGWDSLARSIAAYHGSAVPKQYGRHSSLHPPPPPPLPNYYLHPSLIMQHEFLDIFHVGEI